MPQRILISIVSIFIIFLVFTPCFATVEKEYDTAFIITHYSIDLSPDFDNNATTVRVECDAQNIAEPTDKMTVWLCSTGNTDDYVLEIGGAYLIEGKQKVDVPMAPSRIRFPEYPDYEFTLQEVQFPRQIQKRETFRLKFIYCIKGRQSEECFPICKGPEKELYLISDFKWLPTMFTLPSPGRFDKLHNPTWSLRVTYPSGYAAAVDGMLKQRHEKNDIITEEWESVIGGHPQIMISQYEVVKETKDGFTIEIYCPKDEGMEDAALHIKDDLFRILNIYSGMYGHPGSSTYRLVATHSPWGGHGMYMGQALAKNYLTSMSLNTMAHEIAHTWWGMIITSYEEGSKFLREAIANFSAAWALRQIKGEEYSKNFWREFKWRTFSDYYLARDNEVQQYPIVIQEGHDAFRSVSANYHKGALVLNALRIELDDEVFFQALKALAVEFKDRHISMSDFINTMNRETQRDLTSLIKNLCWGTGFPSYRLVDLESTKKNGLYETTVTIRNDGEFGVSCPLMLRMETGEQDEWFKVDGGKESRFVFSTKERVVDAIIDPDIIAFHYHPDQKLKLWELLDASYFSLRNWMWFNKSFAYYRMARYEKAIDILSEYFTRCQKNRNMATIEEVGKQPLYGSYFLTRSFYYLAAKDVNNAVRDMKIAIPTLFEALADELIMTYLTRSGIIKQSEPQEQILTILSHVTEKEFLLEPESDEDSKKNLIEEWKAWWDEEGKNRELNLNGLYERYGIQSDK